MVEEYLKKRTELKRAFLIIDYRHKPTNDDVMMYNFLKYYRIPTTIVATKADKLSSNERNKNLKLIKDTLDIVVGDNLTIFSSVTKEGKEEIIKVLEENLKWCKKNVKTTLSGLLFLIKNCYTFIKVGDCLWTIQIMKAWRAL